MKCEGKYGYVNNEGQSVIPCMFASASHFSDGVAAVELDEKSGTAFIDSEGNMIIKPHKYDEVGFFVNGVCLVRKGDKTYHIDKNGRKIKE